MKTHVLMGKIKINTPFHIYINGTLAAFEVGLLPIDWKAPAYLTMFNSMEIAKPLEKQNKDIGIIKYVKKELRKSLFDRMILAHAIALNLPLVSPDQLFPFCKPLGLSLHW